MKSNDDSNTTVDLVCLRKLYRGLLPRCYVPNMQHDVRPSKKQQ